MTTLFGTLIFGFKVALYFVGFLAGIFLGIIMLIIIADFLFKIFYSFK